MSPADRAPAGALPGPADWPETAYWMWLAGLLGPASRHAAAVLAAWGGSARAAWQASQTPAFARAAGKAAARRLAEGRSPGDYLPVLALCRAKGVRVLPFNDPDFPAALRDIPDPPLVLYVTGRVAALHSGHTVGMVGTRRPSSYGVRAAVAIGSRLARAGAVIVSGLADGLDGESHRAAVEAGAATVGVLGVPIDQTYPAANAPLRARIEATGGAVVSEYAPGAAGLSPKYTFLQRNRIIAALSLVLVVIEARRRSGTMSTVAHAQRYGRPVYAVPGSARSALSEGTNGLLAAGQALPLRDPAVVLAALGLADAPALAAGPAAALPAAELAQPKTAPVSADPQAGRAAPAGSRNGPSAGVKSAPAWAGGPAAGTPRQAMPGSAQAGTALAAAAGSAACGQPALAAPLTDAAGAAVPPVPAPCAASAAAAGAAEEDAPAPLSPDALCVLEAVGCTPVGVEALAAATGLPAERLLAALAELEMGSRVDLRPGRQYVRI